MKTKICSKCKIEKSFDGFYKIKNRKIGIRSSCKICVDKDNIQYLENHKEERTNYIRNYTSKNKKKITKRSSNWWKRNKNILKEKRNDYQKFHKQETRNRNLKSKYGISLDQYNKMAQEQNSICAICSKPEENKNKSLSVDHNHISGKIRGLLCSKCNKMLGLVNDSPELLNIAIKYLLKSEN
jgi:hypothetical protein